jgi:hypothetical protein
MEEDSLVKIKEDVINYVGDKDLDCQLLTIERLRRYLKQLEIELPNSLFVKEALKRIDIICAKEALKRMDIMCAKHDLAVKKILKEGNW